MFWRRRSPRSWGQTSATASTGFHCPSGCWRLGCGTASPPCSAPSPRCWTAAYSSGVPTLIVANRTAIRSHTRRGGQGSALSEMSCTGACRPMLFRAGRDPCSGSRPGRTTHRLSTRSGEVSQVVGTLARVLLLGKEERGTGIPARWILLASGSIAEDRTTTSMKPRERCSMYASHSGRAFTSRAGRMFRPRSCLRSSRPSRLPSMVPTPPGRPIGSGWRSSRPGRCATSTARTRSFESNGSENTTKRSAGGRHRSCFRSGQVSNAPAFRLGSTLETRRLRSLALRLVNSLRSRSLTGWCFTLRRRWSFIDRRRRRGGTPSRPWSEPQLASMNRNTYRGGCSFRAIRQQASRLPPTAQ
jgi:hypothetical protein